MYETLLNIENHIRNKAEGVLAYRIDIAAFREQILEPVMILRPNDRLLKRTTGEGRHQLITIRICIISSMRVSNFQNSKL
jgi:hypothetical protein